MRTKLRLFYTPTNIIIIFITLLGAFFRLLSYQYNEIPHGDIYLDYAAGLSFLKTGKLTLPLITIRPYLESRFESGIPLDQHAPLWPLLGGVSAKITGDVFVAFKLLSFIIGTSMIPISYLAFSQAFGKKPALLATTLITFSYILIDYSGNGSLYIFHSLLFILVVSFIRTDRRINSALLGGLTGLLYLLNYQSVVSIFALVAVYIVKYGYTKAQKNTIINLFISLACMVLIILPWLIRNHYLFGNPFFNINTGYILSNLKVPSKVVLIDKYLVQQTIWDQYDLRQIPGRILGWTLRNYIYFVVRIIVLAPIVSLFVPYASWQLVSRRKKGQVNETSWMTALLLIFHLAISCFWPVFKFRYFVPLLPLLFGLGSYGIFSIHQRSKIQKLIAITSMVSVIFVSFTTFLRVPSHTNYYDSNEFFNYRTGEEDWLTNESLLMDAAANIINTDPTAPIIGSEPSLFYHLHRPIVIVNNLKDPTIIQFLVREYNIQYIVDRHSKETFYMEFLDLFPIYTNAEYVVLGIHQR